MEMWTSVIELHDTLPGAIIVNDIILGHVKDSSWQDAWTRGKVVNEFTFVGFIRGIEFLTNWAIVTLH